MRKPVLVVLAMAALLAACKSTRDSGMVPIEPALLSLVPADTIALAGARIDMLQKTQVWQKHLAQRRLPVLDELAAKTGIDVRRDVWQVLIASDGKRMAVLVRGKFSEMGMEPRLNIAGAQRIPYKGRTLIGREEAAVCFLSPTTAILGKGDAVRFILDQKDSASLPPALGEALKTVPASSQVWLVALGGGNPAELGIPQEGNIANLNRIYASLQQLTIAAEMGDGVKVHAKGISVSEEEAQRLAAALKGLIGLGRLNTPDNRPDLLKVYDAMKVDQQQRNVAFDAELPGDLLEKALALLGPSASL